MSAAGSSAGPPTIASHEDSTIDGKVFDWDDDIVNAETYRRALKHNTSKKRVRPVVVPQQDDRLDTRNYEGNTDFQSPMEGSLQSTPIRPLPYENSIASEPTRMIGSASQQYLPLSSRSDVATESRHHLPIPQRSPIVRKKSIWSSLSLKRSGNAPSAADLAPESPVDYVNRKSSIRRGRRGNEATFHASIDFGSEEGLSAPSIVRAAQAGSVREVEMLLHQGSDVNTLHVQSGRSALAVASHCGNEDVVGLLLQHGAHVNIHDASSMTPLHLAASRGHRKVVELLLQERALIDEKGPNDMTPLRMAADSGHVEVAELLLRRRAKVNARDRRHVTALHMAAKQGDEAMVDLLATNEAHIEAKDGGMMAPIHHACECGHERIVALLLDKKADIEAPGKQLKTPLLCASAAGQVHVVSFLLKRKANIKHKAEGDMTALHWACYNEQVEVADLLLKKKASPNTQNKNGRTPLHLATMAGSFAITELLLRRGAAVEAQCDYGNRPLHYACQHDTTEIAQLLLGCGANAHVEDREGQRPLHIACARGSAALVDLLLQQGVDTEIRDQKGDRPVSLASSHGHLEVLQILLDRGAPLRSRFADGPSHEDSPLCVAAKHGHASIVEFLINRGSSVLQKDEHDWQPLRYAAFYAHPQVVSLLINAGAKVSGHYSGGWGFDLTAQRIGFANEVAQEEQRKRQVLQILIEAEAREQRMDHGSANGFLSQTSPASISPNSPKELGSTASVEETVTPTKAQPFDLNQRKASHRGLSSRFSLKRTKTPLSTTRTRATVQDLPNPDREHIYPFSPADFHPENGSPSQQPRQGEVVYPDAPQLRPTYAGNADAMSPPVVHISSPQIPLIRESELLLSNPEGTGIRRSFDSADSSFDLQEPYELSS